MQLVTLFSTAPMSQRFEAIFDVLDYDASGMLTLDEMVRRRCLCNMNQCLQCG